MVVFKLA